MALSFISEATCFACGVKIEGFRLHEISPGQWEIFCLECDHTLELDGGK